MLEQQLIHLNLCCAVHSLSLFQSFNKSNNFLWRKSMHDFLSWFVSFFPKTKTQQKMDCVPTNLPAFHCNWYDLFLSFLFRFTIQISCWPRTLSHLIRVLLLLFTIHSTFAQSKKDTWNGCNQMLNKYFFREESK